MIKEKAYAKINLFLNVVRKREDGFHDLEMVMAPIDLFDTLTFKELESQEIIIKSDTIITNKIEDNLVYKVAKTLQIEYHIKQGVEITINKKIPMAAGLAGGSADAAATLRGLNKLWKLELSLDHLATIGEKFGSDIPFCIYNKLCVAKGKGENLVFLNKKLKLHVLLINPNIKVSTPQVFNMVKKEDLINKKITKMTSPIYNNQVDLVEKELFNFLEQYTFLLEPRIKEIKDKIQEQGITGVLMSGSGATVFAISKDKKKLQKAYDLFNDLYFKKLTKIN